MRGHYKWAAAIGGLVAVCAVALGVYEYRSRPPFAADFVLVGPNYVFAWRREPAVGLSRRSVVFVDRPARVLLVVKAEVRKNMEWEPRDIQDGRLVIRRLDDGWETAIPWGRDVIMQ